ncbi:MAG: hypothetical protein QXT53_05450 [Ignisphaera sp.]
MRMARLNNILSDIIRSGRVVVISPYSNFNIAFSIHLLEGLDNRGIGACIDFGGSNISEHVVVDLCGDSEIRNGLCISSTRQYHVIKIVDEASNCFGNEGTNVICITSRFGKRPGFEKMSYAVYSVRGCGPNLYRLSRISGGREEFYTFLKIANCRVVEYEIPQDLQYIIDELDVIVRNFGSVKASDFLKYVSKKLNMDRESVLNLIRLGISLGVIKYEGGYLFVYQ